MYKQMRYIIDKNCNWRIYEECIDETKSKFLLFIAKDVKRGRYPTILTKRQINKLGLKAVSEITISQSNNSTSFISNDIHDILDDSIGKYSYFELMNLYTEKQYRNNGYGKILLSTTIQLIKTCYKNSVIFTYAGVSIREYPKEPVGEECDKAIEKAVKFYENNGFVSINDFSNFENGESMIYVGDDMMIDLLKFYQSNKENKNTNSIIHEEEKSSSLYNNLINQLIKPKMSRYEILYTLKVPMRKVIDAEKYFNKAWVSAEYELMNMDDNEKIKRFLDSVDENGFRVNSIIKRYTL